MEDGLNVYIPANPLSVNRIVNKEVRREKTQIDIINEKTKHSTHQFLGGFTYRNTARVVLIILWKALQSNDEDTPRNQEEEETHPNKIHKIKCYH